MDAKFLTFILLLFLCCENACPRADGVMCKENERKALLSFKKGLIDQYGWLSSWGSQQDKKECCNWYGVLCSNITGHVVRLDLQENTYGGEISLALTELHHLNYLDLSRCNFEGNKIPEFIGSLKKLEYLSLLGSNFSGDVPYQLGNLTNLRSLDLSFNHLTSKDLTWLSNLSSLSSLDLSNNQFTGPLPYLTNLPLLSRLDLSYNKFIGPIPDLKPLLSLTKIFLSDNKLTGFPTTIFQLFQLERLDVSNNSLQGTISEVHLSKLHNLTSLILSFNSLTLNLTPEWVPPFQLDIIGLGRCNMGPRFPTWLQTQTKFSCLDLCSNGISSQAPTWLWDQSRGINYIDLSENQFSGSIPMSSSNIVYLNLSSNNFSGHVPLFHPDSYVLQLSGNMFSGLIQSLCTVTYNNLQILDLSRNQLFGHIPDCWQHMPNLGILNLADNKFYGHLPRSLGSLISSLTFRNNKLTGELPSPWKNFENLKLIDVGGNKLTGNVPKWLGKLKSVSVLSLRHNNLYGNIPPEICRLSQIQVLDLSHNSLSGTIPQCFEKFTSLRQTMAIQIESVITSSALQNYTTTFTYVNDAMVQWKRLESEYKNTLGLLKLIDLSSNKLVGNIPPEISRLAALGSLNLSRNCLTGNINRDIDAMTMLEILDLSKNNLSGEILTSLTRLHYLDVLDLSDNSLSGKIPKSIQLQTFDASTYAGNKELCGDPLSNCPGDNSTLSYAPNQRENIYEGGFNMIQSLFEEYFISALLGFIVGFWGIMGPISFKRSWRKAYYGYWSKIGDRLCFKQDKV